MSIIAMQYLLGWAQDVASPEDVREFTLAYAEWKGQARSGDTFDYREMRNIVDGIMSKYKTK